MEDLNPIDKMGLIKIHTVLGTIVLIATLFRSYLFFKAPRPADLKTGSKFNDKLAVFVHNIFYFLLIGIAISGIWSGVGICAFGSPDTVPLVAICAAFATVITAAAGS